jgi:hypothetical protein
MFKAASTQKTPSTKIEIETCKAHHHEKDKRQTALMEVEINIPSFMQIRV